MLVAPIALKLSSSPGRAHFVGIGGSGMRALAAVMSAQGWRVSGSDLEAGAQSDLATLGVRVSHGHSATNVTANTQLLIYSAAVPAENAERRRAVQLGIPTLSYAEMLGRITANRCTLAVAGTHGKSTVTAMAGEILIRAALDPTIICGAAPVLHQSGGLGHTGGHHGRGKIALVEACEYRGNFLHLRPNVAALLNIEPDHFDAFPTSKSLSDAFAGFLANAPEDGRLIVSEECARAKETAAASGRSMATFGFSRNADWRAGNLEHSRGRYRFDLVRHGRRLTHISLAVPGRHNVLNALAAAALTRHCGASVQQIAQGLALFRGLQRRLQARGRWGEASWIDDYAHHPTALSATLAAVRQMFPRRRLWCVFQPHQASRLAILLDELAASLHNADKIAVADVFRAREGVRCSGEATSADLAAALRCGGADVLDEHRPAAIARRLTYELQSRDVLVTMGAGDLGKIFHQFQQRLRRNRAVA